MRPLARKKRVKKYFLPFLIIIGVGWVTVFLIKLYLGWSSEPRLNEAQVFVVEGQAKIQSWSAHQWHAANNIDRLLSGDKIRTSRRAQVVLHFYDDVQLRLGADTQLGVEEIFSEDEGKKVVANFTMGDLWVENANLLLNMNDLRFQADAEDVVSVEQNQAGAAVRVIEGSLDIDVLKFTDTKMSVVDTVHLVKGQEAIFRNEDLLAFREYQLPYVEYDITDEFWQSSWYLWNKDLQGEIVDYSYLAEKELEDDQFLDLDPPAKPIVLSPPNLEAEVEYNLDAETLTLIGTSSEDTSKMKVIYMAGNALETHNLIQFKAGSGQWAYYIGISKGNLAPGLNTYQVFALDELGNESEPLVIKVMYGKADAEVLDEDAATPQAS